MWLVVNYFDSGGEFEQFDVSDMQYKKKKSWLKTLIHAAGYLTYVPTTWEVIKYVLNKK